MHGVTSRSIEEVEGLQLIKIKGDYGIDRRIKRLKNELK
jgi:hypothetical protein